MQREEHFILTHYVWQNNFLKDCLILFDVFHAILILYIRITNTCLVFAHVLVNPIRTGGLILATQNAF